MRVPRLSAIALGVGALFVLAPTAASAITLGSVDTTSAPPACLAGPTSAFFVQTGTASIPYTVPAGGGIITSWSTSFGPAGAPVTLLVTGPGSSSSPPSFPIADFDAETFPSPVPVGNVATFTLSHPMFVQAGDLIGLYYTGSSGTACLYASTSSSDVTSAGPASSPAVGGSYAATTSFPDSLTNISVNLLQSADMAVSGATATPSAVTTGGIADLAFPVTSSPQAPGTFTDTLPTGLVPIIATAGGGSCTIAAQSVSCPVNSTAATVRIAVQGSTAGTYTDTGQITGELSDPNPANNSGSVTLAVVSPPPTPTCHVIKLKGAPIAVARAVLPLLNCKVGKISKASSKAVRKGDVVSTSPGPGADPAGTKVSVKVSSGRKKKKAKRGH